MNGALQSVAIVAVFGAAGWWLSSRLMTSDARMPRDLGPGFVDATGRRRRWEDVIAPKEPARLRTGVR